MKALSLWEPWASAMALGIKKVETRSWATNYRGPLLICASKRKMDDCSLEVCEMITEWSITSKQSEVIRIHPKYGQAVCIVDLIRCDRIVAFEPIRLEHFLGDYTPGRFAWITDNLRKLLTPFPVRGAQGLFDVSDDIPLQPAL